MAKVQKEITKIGIIKNLNDMQGPCDIGFHVPTSDEWNNFNSTKNSLVGNNANNFLTYFKMPKAGVIQGNSISNKDNAGCYWSSTPTPTNISNYQNSAYGLNFSSGTYIYPRTQDYRKYGRSIRPFKDTPVEPDSTWTVLYGTLGNNGIFWNQNAGLITMKSGTTLFTIADKNLGATVVYNSGDTLSQANCGYMYQRGNNYGFAWANPTNTSTSYANATEYGPGNYYSSDVWRNDGTSNGFWDASYNQNLRGGVTQQSGLGEVPIKKASIFKTGTLYTNMQGPCDEGFHIPSNNECNSLMTMYGQIMGNYKYSIRVLKIPPAGVRQNYNSVTGQGSSGSGFWCCDGYNNTSAYYCSFSDSTIYTGSTQSKVEGKTLRPFKDVPVTPDDSRSVISGSLDGNGIFWSSSLGLITLKYNNNLLTIADKNLGATTVWNYGDTATADNCGKYYQWGNNYGFAWSGNVTGSSSKVNASNYGPGNYYSGSSFIYPSDGTGIRDSSGNNNLWGYESGTTQGLIEHIIFEIIPPAPVEDVIVTSTSTSIGNTSYYWGICITPKVNCTLDKIKFQTANPYGTVKICQGDYISSTTGQVTYSKASGSGQEFTLPTPYEMIAGTNYCIGLKGTNGSYYSGNPSTTDLTNITYKGGTYSDQNQWLSNVYNISSVTTTQTS